MIFLNDTFSFELSGNNIYFYYANGKSRAIGKEFHTFYEIILFLDGKANLITDKLNMEIVPKRIIIIPKETYHQLIIKGNENNYLRCVFQFDNTPFLQADLSDVKVFNIDQKIETLYGILMDKAKNSAKDTDIILKSVLALITDNLSQKEITIPATAHGSLATMAVEFINQNIEKKFTSNDIAESLHISLSTLQHTFKKEMQIPLYQYILKRRLVTARQQILSGIPATNTAIDLGFSDYSGFYKQYKKLFGVTPSQTEKQQ